MQFFAQKKYNCYIVNLFLIYINRYINFILYVYNMSDLYRTFFMYNSCSH